MNDECPRLPLPSYKDLYAELTPGIFCLALRVKSEADGLAQQQFG